MYSPEMISKIALWRQKVNDRTITEAELGEAIRALRQERVGAAIASDASRRKKAKAAIPSADDMLKELGVDL